MKKAIVLAVLFLVTIAAGQHWELEQVDAASSCGFVQLVRDGGTLWLAYATPDTQVRVARYDTAWVFEDIDTSLVRPAYHWGWDRPLSLAISPAGRPAVAAGRRLALRSDSGWTAVSVPLSVLSCGLSFDPEGHPGLVCLTDTWDVRLAVLGDTGWTTTVVRDEQYPQYVWWASVGQPVWRSNGDAVVSYSFAFDMGGIISWGSWAALVQQGDSWRRIRSGGGRSGGGEAFATVLDSEDSIHVFWTEGGLYTVNMTAYDNDSLAGTAPQGACVLDSLDRPHVVWSMTHRVWYGYRTDAWHVDTVPGTIERQWCDVAASEPGQPIVAFVAADGSIWLARGVGIVGTEERDKGGSAKVELPSSTVMRAAELARMDCRVLDIMGRDVTERKALLSPGVYFVRAASGVNREAASVRKVVIQR